MFSFSYIERKINAYSRQFKKLINLKLQIEEFKKNLYNIYNNNMNYYMWKHIK